MHATRIYIPGLGDESTLDKQRTIVKKWGDALFFEPKWHSKETFAKKYSRLQQLFDDHPSVNKLIGASAGGGLALAFYGPNRDRINKLYLVSSKFRMPEAINAHYQKSAPALLQTVNHSNQVLANLTNKDTAKIVTYRPLFDNVILAKSMTIDGATNKLIPVIGHATGIALVLLLCLKR